MLRSSSTAFDRKLTQDRLVVGIGGQSGAGKTTIVNELRRFGSRVIDADTIGQGLLRKGSPESRKVVKEFGDGILTRGFDPKRNVVRPVFRWLLTGCRR